MEREQQDSKNAQKPSIFDSYTDVCGDEADKSTRKRAEVLNHCNLMKNLSHH